MSFTARLWPDGKPQEGYRGMVRSKRIAVNKLPSYPDRGIWAENGSFPYGKQAVLHAVFMSHVW